MKRSLIKHLELTKDSAAEKVIEFGAKSDLSEGVKKMLELDNLIKKKQMELISPPKRQFSSSNYRSVNGRNPNNSEEEYELFVSKGFG